MKSFLAEDIGSGDLTTEAIIPELACAEGRFVAKSPLILSGLDAAIDVFRLLDDRLTIQAQLPEGSVLKPGDEAAIIRARARALLSGERVALNILQRMCGIATLAGQYVRAVEGTAARIVDTRKTTPGLRWLEKRAVAASGAHNHRRGLDDAILIKENHIRLAGGVAKALESAGARRGKARFIEIEVTTLDEVREALGVPPEMILLDNMTVAEARRAIALIRERDSKITVEVSGGITLANVREYGEAGADWISVGALTHSAPAADISFEIEPVC